jgi:hypothetical protein
MEMKSYKTKMRICLGLLDYGHEHGDFDSELILGRAGGDPGVCVGIDIGINPEGYVGSFIEQRATFGYNVKLGFGFHIETGDACLQRQVNLPFGFAYAGKYYCRGIESVFERHADFTSADTVYAQSMLSDEF